MGIPSVCQDLCTYDRAFHKFNTGEDLIKQIDNITKDTKKYNKEVKRARDYMNSRWMEDNISFYTELYSFPYGDPRRKNLNRLNRIA